ncbi:hypothetical protein OHU34_27975 [Streptomyces sp. NBC_00080]|uniref:Lipoprotein n=2 Tax=Streptomyces TaxID=1883 RepID=A0A6M4WPF8_9ACTN|nr:MULTISPECIES: hypothetical protein [Streptomyces]KQX82525.1 hypothetical protein ASD48_04415 [Streptomyces sp. Root1310]QJT01601.1 hypothetical protein G9272_15835 [Streptomyces asoensis]TQJ52996.1 hypothetical protein FBY34_0710 [Streptomyces sp. SLBN-115]
MRGKRIGSGAAMLVGALAVTGLALAPSAVAVTPLTATVTANCGLFGGGAATLTATQTGTAATLKLSSTAITAPIPIGANSISSTLTMANSTGAARVFSGAVNPAMATGDPITVGPLNGTVASGDSLNFYGGSLKMVVFGITVTCTANAAQAPGPFVFS